MRSVAAVLVAALGCDPTSGPFRPESPRPGPTCRDLPKLPADLPPEGIPRVDIDIDNDGHPDHVVPSNCDADGNCDLAAYVGEKSCAILVAQVRGKDLRIDGIDLTASELFMRNGVEIRRKTMWRRDPETRTFGPPTRPWCTRPPENTVVDCDQALGPTAIEPGGQPEAIHAP